MSALSLETCRSFLKSIALTVLELLAFNAQKFRGSRDPGHAPFRKILRVHVHTVPGNIHVKFEVRSFNPSTGSRGQIDPRPYKLFNIKKWF